MPVWFVNNKIKKITCSTRHVVSHRPAAVAVNIHISHAVVRWQHIIVLNEKSGSQQYWELYTFKNWTINRFSTISSFHPNV